VLRLLGRLEPQPPGRARHLAAALRGAPQVIAGAARVARDRDRVGDPIIILRTIAEQAPNPDSRVTLSDRRDRFGVPLPRLDWRFTELDRRSLRTTQELMDAALRQAGIGRVEQLLGDLDEPELFVGQWHHMGTTRMHDDPRYGVVDADSRVHGTTNLYVTGASVFATGGAVNPTLTAVAMGLRLADHLTSQGMRPSGRIGEGLR
jgi:choline dehydrogenase-like flavoprotein